ncbi:hypothetical protein DFA_10975 [Cavenderia fasciculata]|uniref:TH1 domain-containing protein n=1 Tax=Cavenderia fasciculata TaxID=261658 RepID=F4QBX8_CACFS|nr:uncharacterized protein DFA_10975 [Cavenderia fasciculata]EGG14716.1 hypothetical protein DFA_10975 [Cavenderia fasciculata]|eukprot:XP_004351224.1 hypothetical protein DFA_10975 [Cavenderia fasciculata]
MSQTTNNNTTTNRNKTIPDTTTTTTTTPSSQDVQSQQTVLGTKMLSAVGIIESVICIIEYTATLILFQSTLILITQYLPRGSLPHQIMTNTNVLTTLSYTCETIYILYRYKYLFKYVQDLPKWFGITPFSFKLLNIKFDGAKWFMILQMSIFIVFLLLQYTFDLSLFSLNNVIDSTSGNIDFAQLSLSLFVAPVSEEILFRGIIFYCLKRRNNNLKFCVLTSNILFGLYHIVNAINADMTMFYINLQIWLDAKFMGKKKRRNSSISKVFLGDFLSLSNNVSILKLISRYGDNRILFSDVLIKVNKRNKMQERIIFITDSAIYNVTPSDYKLKRRIAIASCSSISMSTFEDNFIVIHVQGEYD